MTRIQSTTWSCSAAAAVGTPRRCEPPSSGLSVALVEKDKVGGTCLHRGCIPTKAMLHAAEVADAARNGSQFGVHATLDGSRPAGGQPRTPTRWSARLYKGLQRPDHGARRSPWSRARADWSPARAGAGACGSATSRSSAGTWCWPPARTPKTLPGLEIDGERVLTSESRAAAGDAARLGGGARRRGDRRRVRLGLALVRRRRHGRRGAAPAGPERGAGDLGRPRARLPQARDHRPDRRRRSQSAETTDDRVALALADGTRIERRRGAGGGRPRTGRAHGLGYEEAGVALDRGLVAGRRAAPDLAARRVRRRRPGGRSRSWPTGASPTASSWPRRSPTGSAGSTVHRFRSATSRCRG